MFPVEDKESMIDSFLHHVCRYIHLLVYNTSYLSPTTVHNNEGCSLKAGILVLFTTKLL